MNDPTRCKYCGGEMTYISGSIRWNAKAQALRGREIHQCADCFAQWCKGAQGSVWLTSLVSSVRHDP